MKNEIAKYSLAVTDAPRLRFTGVLLATVESTDQKDNDYSGQLGCWEELSIYKSNGGKFVCHSVNHTRWVNEKTTYDGKVCTTIEEITDFFGFGWLAKSLYDEAGIDTDVEVDA